MASSKLGTKARRWLRNVHSLVFALPLLTCGSEFAHSQGEDWLNALNQNGAIAGLMAGCDNDFSGWEKIDQWLDTLPHDKVSLIRPFLDKAFTKAQFEQVVEANDQKEKFSCDQLKSTGTLAKLKQILFANMNKVINAP